MSGTRIMELPMLGIGFECRGKSPGRMFPVLLTATKTTD